MVSAELILIIERYAEEYKIPEEIIYGICKAESNLQMLACRYEPNYKWTLNPAKTKPKLCSVQTEEIFQKVSWGLMQCMGAVYRELGYTDWLPAVLADRNLQVMYGVKHLSGLKKRFPDGNDYIAAYNAGSPRKLSSGKYVNNNYVNKVLEFSKEWKNG